MKKYIIVIAILGLMVAGVAYADFTPSVWKYEKSIESGSTNGDTEYLKVNLDKEVSVNANSDLSDLRVIGNGTQETPYQLVVENETVRNEYFNSQMRDLSVKAQNTMFILDLGASGHLHDHLSIMSTSKNFKHSVSVYAADMPLAHADSGWRLLTDRGYIYNFSDRTSGFDAGSGEVFYPESTSRYLRVVIGAGEGEAVTVSDAKVYQLSRKESQEEVMQLPLLIAENQKYKSTELTLDLGGEGIPTHEVTLAVKETKNFNRRATVEGSNDAKTWSALGDRYVFSLETPLFSGTQLTLAYPETRMRYIRVLIWNEDNTPIEWERSATVKSIVRAVVFAPEINKSYALYYGNEKAATPHYDLARFFQYIESAALAHASLAAQVANPTYTPPPPPTVPYTEKKKGILNGALVMLVAVVTFLIISYLKKLKLSNRGPQK